MWFRDSYKEREAVSEIDVRRNRLGQGIGIGWLGSFWPFVSGGEFVIYKCAMFPVGDGVLSNRSPELAWKGLTVVVFDVAVRRESWRELYNTLVDKWEEAFGMTLPNAYVSGAGDVYGGNLNTYRYDPVSFPTSTAQYQENGSGFSRTGLGRVVTADPSVWLAAAATGMDVYFAPNEAGTNHPGQVVFAPDFLLGTINTGGSLRARGLGARDVWSGRQLTQNERKAAAANVQAYDLASIPQGLWRYDYGTQTPSGSTQRAPYGMDEVVANDAMRMAVMGFCYGLTVTETPIRYTTTTPVTLSSVSVVACVSGGVRVGAYLMSTAAQDYPVLANAQGVTFDSAKMAKDHFNATYGSAPFGFGGFGVNDAKNILVEVASFRFLYNNGGEITSDSAGYAVDDNVFIEVASWAFMAGVALIGGDGVFRFITVARGAGCNGYMIPVKGKADVAIFSSFEDFEDGWSGTCVQPAITGRPAVTSTYDLVKYGDYPQVSEWLSQEGF